MGRFPSLSSKYRSQFLWILASSTAAISIICGAIYYGELQALKRTIKIDQEQEQEQKQQFILSDFETAIADLQILAGDPGLVEVLAIEGSRARVEETLVSHSDSEHIESQLLAFMSSKSLYHQARLLDREGREVFRVNQRRQEPARIVPKEKLQDKSDRPYFQRSKDLAEGEVYISPFDLNREDGVIENPLVPVIRFATPLIDDEGKCQGVLVLNYRGTRLLRHFDAKEKHASYLGNVDPDKLPTRSHLINGIGYWLNHHDPSREWGFALEERSDQSLPEQRPELWNAMKRQSQGSFVSDKNIYTFLKLPLLSLVQDYNRLGKIVVNHRAAHGYNWRVLIVTPRMALAEQMRPLIRQLALSWIGLSALFAPLIWNRLLAQQDKEKAQQKLVESQEELALQEKQADVLSQRLSSQIRDSLDAQAVITTAITEVSNLLRSDRCSFAWIDSDQGLWDVVYEAKREHLSELPSETFDRTPLIKAFEDCELLCIDNVACLANRDIKAILERYGHSAVLASRITTQARKVGVLLCGLAEPRAWNTLDIELLKGVSEQVAIALNQAELFRMSQRNAIEAHNALTELKKAQTHLIHSEKMSGLGQMVAGVAHEINNPVNFIYGNVKYVTDYVNDLLEMVKGYQSHFSLLPAELEAMQEDFEWDFIQEDLPKVLKSMHMGADRIREIVKSLRTFSRLDESEQKSVDIHSGLESTLMILASRLKTKGDRPAIELIKDYGEMPDIECYPGLLNQVFMNLLANAIDALESACDDPAWGEKVPTITVRTSWDSDRRELEVEISDNGTGMDAQTQSKLFDPFFTTKPVGKGTGLGLSISYQIIVENHKGTLSCESQLGHGTTFTIHLPQPQNLPAKAQTQGQTIRTAVQV
ncbi:MAG: ATP-binding protein [Cyanophyceae cyanobacterium]